MSDSPPARPELRRALADEADRYIRLYLMDVGPESQIGATKEQALAALIRAIPRARNER